jgi:GTP cyclohydrolase I
MTHHKSKTDAPLGLQVHEHLKELGIETPMHMDIVQGDLAEKTAKLTELFTEVWKTIGMDLTDDSLMDTPRRMAKMYLSEIYWGLDYNKFPKCTTIENKMKMDSMVVIKDINIQSNCEHHGVVITGNAVVAYIPKDKVIGLSKINRICEFFAKRPQVQERLTEQVFHTLSYIMGTDDIAVFIEAEHFCVKSRGIQDLNSSTVTSRLGGAFKEDARLRNEFMDIANRNSLR